MIRHWGPRIEQSPDVCGGKPCISGTRVRVQDIVAHHEFQGMSPDEIASGFPHLTLADIHSALAYYFDNQDEIRLQMNTDEAFVTKFRQDYLGNSRFDKGADEDSVSP